MSRYLVTSTLLGGGVLAACLFATVQTGNCQAPPAPSPQSPTYRPGLGDLMTMTVQPGTSSWVSQGARRTGRSPPMSCTNWKSLSSGSRATGRNGRKNRLRT